MTYVLAWSLVVVGLIQSVIRPSDASHAAAALSPHLTSNFKASTERAAPDAGQVDESTQASVKEAYKKLPLRFEENRGQVNKDVRYLARGTGSTLFLTQSEAVLTLRREEKKEKATQDKAFFARRLANRTRPQPSSMSVVRMKLHGANRSPHITGEGELSVPTNYFIGNDPQQWQTNVAQYERVRYEQVYPGIDVIYYGQEQNLEYDFEVAPGADPSQIVLDFKGARNLKIEAATGDLLLDVAREELRQQKPVTYQEVDGARREVESHYVIKGKKKIGFKLGAYDRTKPLVIDPRIVFSSYLGGSSKDVGWDIAVDSERRIYVTGYTESPNFPTRNQYQLQQSGGDVFVMKFTRLGSGTLLLLYSTYLGGDSYDVGYGIAASAVPGHAYVTGLTTSSNFPTRHQNQLRQGAEDAFVAKIDTTLIGDPSLIYSTYLGGTDTDVAWDIAVDAFSRAFVTGVTYSTNFPVLNEYQRNRPQVDAFVTKLRQPTPVSSVVLLYSTYLGGDVDDEAYGIALDGAGDAYVTGSTSSSDFPKVNECQIDRLNDDAFVTKLHQFTNSSVVEVIYSTYLGGNSYDLALDIAADAAGNAYVTGATFSADFPIVNGYQLLHKGWTDAFVTKLKQPTSSSSVVISYSTFLGGTSYDEGYGIAATNTEDNVYVTGYTASSNFPIRTQHWRYQGGDDAFVTWIDTTAVGTRSFLYSTYLGGSAYELGNSIATDAKKCLYVTGETASLNFPRRPSSAVQYQGGESDAFAMMLCRQCADADFDGDGKTDIVIWRPDPVPLNYISGSGLSAFQTREILGGSIAPGDYQRESRTDSGLLPPGGGTWHVLNSSDNTHLAYNWGLNVDDLVPGDYFDTCRTHYAVRRPTDGGWYVHNSTNNTSYAAQWGLSTDLPVPVDCDGDGKKDIAVWRPSNAAWYALKSSDGSIFALQWGTSGDIPVPADYDGDDLTDVAVYRPSNSIWYILNSSDNSLTARQLGVNGDKLVPADYDGDGLTDVAVFRPSNATWYVLRSSDSDLAVVQWGLGSDTPVPGDYDGDTQTDIAVWRATTGTWFIRQSLDGSLMQRQFGSNGDIPVPAAYVREVPVRRRQIPEDCTSSINCHE